MSTGFTATFSFRSFSPAPASVRDTCISGLLAAEGAASSGATGFEDWSLGVAPPPAGGAGSCGDCAAREIARKKTSMIVSLVIWLCDNMGPIHAQRGG